MNTYIFAEESNTTIDNPEVPVREYYNGLFGMIRGLYSELDDYSEVHLHVLSEEYGVVDGDEQLAKIREQKTTPVGSNKMIETAKDELLHAATNADVLVILLSTDVFRETVTEQWDELVDRAKPDSVWCLGAARSVLDKINFDGLETKGCSLLIYRRVGVARLGSKTREELLTSVKEKDTE